MEDLKADLKNMDLNKAKSDLDPNEYDLIQKPRTKFTSNVLRRAIPHLNIQDKIGTISMNNMNVLSRLGFGVGTSKGAIEKKEGPKKIYSASILKVPSLNSGSLNNIGAGGIRKKQSGLIKANLESKTGVGAIEEQEEGDGDSDKINSEEDENKSNDESSDSSDSSFGLDQNEDEEALYKKIQETSKEVNQAKEAKDKGEHLDDLVDQEMIDLLNVCKRLHCPKIEALGNKMVKFGENKSK